MKIFVAIVIFLIAKANFVDTQQRLLLRKLQNVQQTGPTWNEIVANILINNGNNLERGTENNNNIWTNPVSQVVLLYKIHIYDKIKNINGDTTDSPSNFDPITSTSDPKNGKPDDTETIVDPKTEIELVEPNYHGKVQKTEGSQRDTEETECPEGSVKSDEGECVDPKSSKFIIGIPAQCSIGYKRDRLGFCRKVF